MIKIYDTNHNYLDFIEIPDNMIETESLEEGLKTLSFSVPLVSNYMELINEEGYIETSDYVYVIKEIDMDDRGWFTIYCKGDIEEIEGSLLNTFDVIDATCNETLSEIIRLAAPSWELQFNENYPNRVQYSLTKKTALECLQQVKQDFRLEYWFDTKEKIIHVYAEGGLGSNRGAVLMNELRMAALEYNGTAYDFATVLYPYGKNGLSIRDVNNNIPYIENFTYCNKRIAAYYFNEDIEYADALKKEAEEYLEKISTPITTYSVKLTSLPPNISIGDNIYLIDKMKKKKATKRVVKITRFLNSPEKDTVELDNEVQNLSKMFYQFQDDYRKNIHYIKENINSLQ